MTMHQPSISALGARRAPLSCLLFALLLAGCAELGGGTASSGLASSRAAPPVESSREEVRTAAASLVDGIRLYEGGRFQEAIAAFDAPAMRAAPREMRVEALKYTAFSYCVTEAYAQCRHAFDLLLGIDADFALRRSERGHPMWGPVFEQAKAASAQERDHASADHDRERWRGIDLWRAR